MIEITDITDFINKLKNKKIKIPKNMSNKEFGKWYKHMDKIYAQKPKIK